MGAKNLVACLVFAGCLVACASVQDNARSAPPAAFNCGDEVGEDLKVCHVDVTVIDIDGKKELMLDPTDRMVDGGWFARSRRIVWVIQTNGYYFKDDNAVTLKGGSGGDFTQLEKTNDRTFRLRAKTRWFNNQFCRSYGIKVYNAATGEEISADPTIANSYSHMDFAARAPGALPTGVCR